MREIVFPPSAHGTSESDLWQAFKKGDREAFASLLDQYYLLLLKYGSRFNADKEVVKDSVHDLFVGLWNRRENLGDVNSVKSYLMLSLRRNMLREGERLKWFTEADRIADDYSFDVTFNVETTLIADEHEKENLTRLRNHLQQLTKRQREAIFLRFTKDMSYEDIALIMSINYRSAVNLVHEGLKLIRKNWVLIILISISIFF